MAKRPTWTEGRRVDPTGSRRCQRQTRTGHRHLQCRKRSRGDHRAGSVTHHHHRAAWCAPFPQVLAPLPCRRTHRDGPAKPAGSRPPRRKGPADTSRNAALSKTARLHEAADPPPEEAASRVFRTAPARVVSFPPTTSPAKHDAAAPPRKKAEKPVRFFARPPCQPPRPDVSPAHPKAAPDGNGAQIAQLVEQRIENPRVAGSIPALGTTHLQQTQAPPKGRPACTGRGRRDGRSGSPLAGTRVGLWLPGLAFTGVYRG